MLDFRNSQISGSIDSMIYLKPLEPKNLFFFVKNKWYVIPHSYYISFFHYINKGDSLYKESGRWDIYVYKNKNGRIIEKYFNGAEGYLP